MAFNRIVIILTQYVRNLDQFCTVNFSLVFFVDCLVYIVIMKCNKVVLSNEVVSNTVFENRQFVLQGKYVI